MKRRFFTTIILIMFMVIVVGIPVALSQEPSYSSTVRREIEKNKSHESNARIGDGISILVAFALGFGYRKWLQTRNAKIDVGKPDDK